MSIAYKKTGTGRVWKKLRTSDGDRLDILCHAAYGHLNGTVEAVLDFNPGLAAQKQPYVAGIVIELPELPAPVKREIQLWS
jgi:phage tail protein X